MNDLFNISVYSTDGSNQTPKVMLGMPCVQYTRMAESMAYMALQAWHFEGALTVAVRTGHQEEHLQSMLPPFKYDGQLSTRYRGMSDSGVNNMLWPLEFLHTYAEWRNTQPKFLVGDEVYVLAMVYQALLVMHQQRVEDIHKSIRDNGPTFGSATKQWTWDWMETVKEWPARYGFEVPWPITPLPHQKPGEYEADRRWHDRRSSKLAA